MASLGMGSISHAMEPVVCLDSTAATEAGHTDGDGDQVPADGDKGYPHHHGGCHGHHIAAPFEKMAAPTTASANSNRRAARVVILVASNADPALRPPQA